MKKAIAHQKPISITLDLCHSGGGEHNFALDSWPDCENRTIEIDWKTQGHHPSQKKTSEEESDVWSEIADALNQWTQKTLDVETRLNTTVSFREKIEASLHRQQLDGFLNHQDIAELRYITGLWTRLLHSTSSYPIGCIFVKRDCLFIEACLNL